MVKTIYLLCGENAFALAEERRRWVSEFSRKYGVDNVVRLDGGKTSFKDIRAESAMGAFLGGKRLIVVDQAVRVTKKELEAFDGIMHEDVIVLFVLKSAERAAAPPKDVPAFCEVRQYRPLTPSQLEQWGMQRATLHGAAFAPGAWQALLLDVGDDQAILATEIDKLAVGADEGVIGIERVHALTVPSPEAADWRIGDLLAAGNHRQSLHAIRQLLDRGAEPYALWGMVLSSLKTFGAVAIGASEGWTAERIADAYGVNPYAARSMLRHARRLDTSRLQKLIVHAAAADIALKTGGVRATDEAPIELLALLDAAVLRY